jgi:hypothetical protein
LKKKLRKSRNSQQRVRKTLGFLVGQMPPQKLSLIKSKLKQQLLQRLQELLQKNLQLSFKKWLFSALTPETILMTLLALEVMKNRCRINSEESKLSN